MALGQKDCWRCGVTFDRTNWKQLACRPCGKAVAKEKEKSRAADHARLNGKRVVGDPMKCGLCSKGIVRTGRNQLYCPPCSVEKIRIDSAAQREKRRGLARAKARTPEAKAERNRKARIRFSSDPAFAMEMRVRTSVKQSVRLALKSGAAFKPKSGRTLDRMPWTTPELVAHLERQFLPGMSWSNMGEWHIDHVQPLSSFRITGLDCPELRAAWSLSNLRPLWAKDNLRKSAKRVLLV